MTMAMDRFPHVCFRDATASDNDAQARGAVRDSLFLMAELRFAANVETVRVRNLSAGGLMADYRQGLEPGLAVECDLRGTGLVGGHVSWSAAGRVGIAFDRQIDPLMARKPVGAGAKPRVVFAPDMDRIADRRGYRPGSEATRARIR